MLSLPVNSLLLLLQLLLLLLLLLLVVVRVRKSGYTVFPQSSYGTEFQADTPGLRCGSWMMRKNVNAVVMFAHLLASSHDPKKLCVCVCSFYLPFLIWMQQHCSLALQIHWTYLYCSLTNFLFLFCAIGSSVPDSAIFSPFNLCLFWVFSVSLLWFRGEKCTACLPVELTSVCISLCVSQHLW